jgi:hypothetical protein
MNTKRMLENTYFRAVRFLQPEQFYKDQFGLCFATTIMIHSFLKYKTI